eukprot:TRINITY_DN16092_c0_g1_i1.p1 TRINITY_DN16092_c0_g1~~TRINITY_DN16092_c0_g1_i1.p1  ORF type:complete len:396 (-),score=94.03 TRINITY_DN16092_c0_g1_i1:344-1531(-)
MFTRLSSVADAAGVHDRYDVAFDPAGKDFIGSGTYGDVYRATERRTGSAYAIKRLPLPLSSEKEFEVQVLRHTNHRNCVSLHEALLTPSHLCVVMELCTGGTLQDLIFQRGRLSQDVARHVTRQILEALHYLHVQLHVAHRDIKPENVLLVAEEPGGGGCGGSGGGGLPTVKLVDFGLARFFGRRNFSEDGERGVPLHHCESIIPVAPAGTLLYAAYETLEEVCQNHQEHETRRGDVEKLDLFSVGVLLYLMLAGRAPFTRTLDPNAVNCDQLRSAVLNGLSFPIGLWPEANTRTVQDLLRQLLDLCPQSRPTAAAALGHPWMQQPQPQPPPPQPQSQPEPQGKNPGGTQEDEDEEKEKERAKAEEPGKFAEAIEQFNTVVAMVRMQSEEEDEEE